MRPSIQSGVKLALLTLLSILIPAARAQPSISVALRTQFAWEGKWAQLKVQAKGTAPLEYQWFFNGTLIPDATNRSWGFSRIQATNEGAYQVIVTDQTSAVTSQVARVMVRPWAQPTGPRIPEPARLDANMQWVRLRYAIPRGALAVVKDGELVLARGYGWADAENHEAFQPDSLCRIAMPFKNDHGRAVDEIDRGWSGQPGNAGLQLAERAISKLPRGCS